MSSFNVRWAQKVLADDPKQSAAEAGLTYVEDLERDGYRRRRCGRGFSYRDAHGKTVRGRGLRARFDALVIPPAWQDVVIARDPLAHLQAVGRDQAGRRQYLYHPDWRGARDEAKYLRVVAFGRVLPRIRRRVAADLEGDGLGRDRVLAAVVRMLETTLIRIGNDEYARDNASYGLTTIRRKHVERLGRRAITLNFNGKADKAWRIEVDDPAVVEVITDCLDTPGYEIFKYYDADGRKRDVTSSDVNGYLKQAASANVTGKDFRTWAGTVLAACALHELTRVDPDAMEDKRLLRAIERVARDLGNTPAICRSCYIHPPCWSCGATSSRRSARPWPAAPGPSFGPSRTT